MGKWEFPVQGYQGSASEHLPQDNLRTPIIFGQCDNYGLFFLYIIFMYFYSI